MSLISREAAVKIAERYSISKGTTIGKHSGIAEIIADEIKSLPSVPAVPLDKLCEWLEDNAALTGGVYISAKGWKRELTLWMEEQDA